MIRDKRRNMVYLEYDYLPLTLVRLVPLSILVHVEMRGEMNSLWDSEPHKQVLNIWGRHCGFSLSGTGCLLSTCHTLIPTSYIHDLSWCQGRSLLPCQNDLTLAFVDSPRATLCVHQPSVSLSVDDESCFPARPSQGHRNPSESCRLPSAHSENSWDQSIWWAFDLLEGPCTCIKLETEWLIGCFWSHRISLFMCKIFCKCDHLEVKVGLMQVY